jgi:glutathione S-transferase
MLALYFSPGSSSMAVHIALHEVGASFESMLVSLAKKDQDRPEFRAINPEGKVPVLLIDGRVLTETAGILFYLARRFPAAGLLPQGDIEAEARVVSWMSFLASTIHPVNRQGLELASRVYGLADQRLGNQDWVVGGRCSIADIHLFRLFWRFSNAFSPESGAFPNIERHYERMLARPAVMKTIEIESAIGYQLP